MSHAFFKVTFVYSSVFKNKLFNKLKSLAFGCLLEISEEGVVGEEELVAPVDSSRLLIAPDSAVAVVPVPILVPKFFLPIDKN